MRFNLKNKQAKTEAIELLNQLIASESFIELKKINKTRTSSQNSALWLYFTQCSDALNEIGYYNRLKLIDGNEIELPWNKDSFHNQIWIPLQIAAFGTESTTKLNRAEIDPIYDVICKWMAELSVQVTFPNAFDAYLRSYEL